MADKLITLENLRSFKAKADEEYAPKEDYVLIALSSTCSDTIKGDHNINVRVLAGALKDGDRIELCAPVQWKSWAVGGTNRRYRHKLRCMIWRDIDVATLAKPYQRIITMALTPDDVAHDPFVYSYVHANSSTRKATLTLRITREVEVAPSTVERFQISNSVPIVYNYMTKLIKPL